VTWDDIDLDRSALVVEWTIVRVPGLGLVRKRTKSSASDRTLALAPWCVAMLRSRRKRARVTGPVFPTSTGTWRDRDNVSGDLRRVRAGTSFDWFVSHTARRTVATLLDGEGLSARDIADQLGHARVSMTQDVYMGRRIASGGAADSLGRLLADEVDGDDAER
jgi:integrase